MEKASRRGLPNEEIEQRAAQRIREREERGLERDGLEWELDRFRDSLYLVPGLLDKGSKVPTYKVKELAEGIYLAELYSLRRGARAELELQEEVNERTFYPDRGYNEAKRFHFYLSGMKHRLLVDTREAENVWEAKAYLVGKLCPLKALEVEEWQVYFDAKDEPIWPYSEPSFYIWAEEDKKEIEKAWAIKADEELPEEVIKQLEEGQHAWTLRTDFGAEASARDFLTAELKACGKYHNSLLSRLDSKARAASQSTLIHSKGSELLSAYTKLNSKHSIEEGEALSATLRVRGKGEGGKLKEPDLKAKTSKTLHLLTAEASTKADEDKYKFDGKSVCRLSLTLDEVGKLLGISNAKAIERRIREDLRTIRANVYSFKKRNGWIDVPIVGGAYGIENGRVYVTLSPDYMKLALWQATPLQLPKALFKTDDNRHAAAFPLGAYLVTASNMNSGKAREYREGVLSVLDNVRELNAKDISKYTARDKARAIERLERHLDHLVEVGALKDWDYCHEKGEALTDEEQDVREEESQLGNPLPWDIAKDCLITWEFTDEYEAERAEPRKRLIEKREEKAKKKEIRKEEAKLRAKKRKERRQAAEDKKLGELAAKKKHSAKKKPRKKAPKKKQAKGE